MEAGTRSNSNRRFQYPPGTFHRVSSILPKETNTGTGMEELAMVSTAPVHAYSAPSTNRLIPFFARKNSSWQHGKFQEKLTKQRVSRKGVKNFIVLLEKQHSQAV